MVDQWMVSTQFVSNSIISLFFLVCPTKKEDKTNFLTLKIEDKEKSEKKCPKWIIVNYYICLCCKLSPRFAMWKETF